MGIRPARPEGFLAEMTVTVLWNGLAHPHQMLGDGAAFGERTRRGKTLLIPPKGVEREVSGKFPAVCSRSRGSLRAEPRNGGEQ